MKEEKVGECSLCKRPLTAVYFGVNKQQHLFNWNCLCFVMKARPILTPPTNT